MSTSGAVMVAATTSLPPIPGEVLDPPPKPTPAKVKQLEARDDGVGTAVGVGYRAFTRFSQSQASLLAGGTAYYLFLAMFSVIAFAYGLTAALGAEQLASYVTDAIGEAFPGLLGDGGIDPTVLRQVGQTTSVVGAVGLLYGGTGAAVAAVRAVHLIYGAPKDPRNVVVARLRALGWLVVLGVLILLSFAMASFTSDVATQVLDALSIDWRPTVLLNIGVVALRLAVNAGIVYLVLRSFGGIRPTRGSRLVGAVAGALAISVLQSLLAVLVGFTIDKPEYGALAAPIGILFVLYLLTIALYGSAALTAGVAERDVPLEVLEAADTGEVQAIVERAADGRRE